LLSNEDDEGNLIAKWYIIQFQGGEGQPETSTIWQSECQVKSKINWRAKN
jgi:hypothetical protein